MESESQKPIIDAGFSSDGIQKKRFGLAYMLTTLMCFMGTCLLVFPTMSTVYSQFGISDGTAFRKPIVDNLDQAAVDVKFAPDRKLKNRIRNISIFVSLICYFSILVLAFPIANIILSQITIPCDIVYEPLSLKISDFLLGSGIVSLVFALVLLSAIIFGTCRTNVSNVVSRIIVLIMLPIKVAWFIIGACILFSANNECIMQEVISRYVFSIWILSFIDLVATICYVFIKYLTSTKIDVASPNSGII